jgi:hypothetical protein
VNADTLDTVAKLGPIAVGLSAIVALIVGLIAVTQKSRADRRDQWWKRAQWAIEQTFDDNEERQALGFRVLQVLGTSELASKEELIIFESLTTPEIQTLAPQPQEGDHDETDTAEGGNPP